MSDTTIDDAMRSAFQSGKWMIAIFRKKGKKILGDAFQRNFTVEETPIIGRDFLKMLDDMFPTEREGIVFLPPIDITKPVRGNPEPE